MRELRANLGDDAHLFDRFAVWAAIFGIVRGLAMATLVPLVPALLTGDQASFWRWMIVLAALSALTAFTHYRQAIAGFTAALKVLSRMQLDIGDHVVGLPLGWFTAARSARVAMLATKGVENSANASAHVISPFISGFSSAATVLVCTLVLDWRLGLSLLCCAPLLYFGQRWATRVADGADERHEQARGVTNERVLEFARCQPVLRASGRSDSFTPLEDSIEQARLLTRRLLWAQVAGLAAGGVLVQFSLSVVVTIAANVALGGDLEPGRLIGVLTLCLVFTQPLTVAFEYGVGMRKAMFSSRRIHDLLTTPALPEPAEPIRELAAPGEVVVDRVGFSYRDDAPVLRDISFTARPGTLTALVGPSGSGKTTLTKLIARFHDTDSGRVLVGGVDVRDQSTSDLMKQLSLVFQDPYLFDDTLRANIALGRADATDAEIEEVARLSGVLEIVERLPQGWDTRVGEGGSLLSGGERQRVSIARALLKQADIVLLDEATAALDPENERAISATMRELARTSTLIVIAHKLTTIADADQIVVLTASGSVEAIGTHSELIDTSAQYASFWAERDRAKGWQLA